MADSYIRDVYQFKFYQMQKIMSEASSLYFAIGRTSAWDDKTPETVPPVQYTDTMQEVIALKKVDSIKYAVPTEGTGDITIEGQKWLLKDTLTEEEKKITKFIYVNVSLDYSKFTLATYRQIGLYIGVTPKSGVSDTDILTPSQVDDYGSLLVLNNRLPISRTSDQKESLSIIIQV